MRSRWRLYRPAEPERGAGLAIALIGLFAALALISRLFCLDAAGTTSFWPANGALVVAILTLSPRQSACCAVACFAINIALNQIASYTPFNDALYSAFNIGVSYLAAFLTRSWCGASIDLTRFRRLATFACIAFVSAGIEAFVGDFLDSQSLNLGFVKNWLQWTLCDGLGLLLGTTAILLSVKARQLDLATAARQAERWLLLAGILSLTVCAFAWARTPLLLLIYPALILVAFRAGSAWVLASVLLVCIIASAMTEHGFGPLVLLSPNGASMREDMMQPFLLSVFLAGLPANNALGEKNRVTSRLRRLKQSMEHSATHDALTLLGNRDLFCRRLAAALRSAAVQAVFFVDLDRFKEVNDTLGHQAGDELLRAFSARLLAAVPPTAIVARFGGDEFAILLPRSPGDSPDEKSVAAMCEQVVTAARLPFQLARGPAHLSASLGVAMSPADPVEAGEILRKADIALYAAKAAGRNGYRVFSQELDQQLQRKAELEADLRTALAGQGGLALHYQLKMDRTGAPNGVEALLRWCHPTYGPIAPNVFIPVAEECGLILPLGAWAFKEAVAFAARWPLLQVAVNVSPIQLRHAGFVDEVLHMLGAANVPARRIEIEITETVFLDEICPATDCLRQLREAGLHIALDDFGTGYSSLRQLQRFKVDRLKIDRAFISTLGEDPEPAAIVQAIVSLGHAMGLRVTAEGIETDAQREHLLTTGVDEFQGYLFARPTDEATLASRLAAFAALEAA